MTSTVEQSGNVGRGRASSSLRSSNHTIALLESWNIAVGEGNTINWSFFFKAAELISANELADVANSLVFGYDVIFLFRFS